MKNRYVVISDFSYHYFLDLVVLLINVKRPPEVHADQNTELISVPQLNQTFTESHALDSDHSTIDLQLDCRYQEHIELRGTGTVRSGTSNT